METSEKIITNFVGFVVKILKVLLSSHGLILDIFNMKNRNMKYLDLP
jgi:hypothetical protein